MRISLQSLLRLLERDKLGRWVALIAIALLAGAMEAVGALFIYVLLGMVTAPEDPVRLPLLGDLRDRLPGYSQDGVFFFAATLIAGFFVLRAVVSVVQSYAQQRVAHNAGVRLATRLTQGYLRAPYALHLQRNSAELIRNAWNSVFELVSYVFLPAAALIAESVLVVAVLIALAATAPAITGLIILVLGPLVLIVLRVVQPRLRRLGESDQRMAQVTLQMLQQSLEGIRDIKLLDKGDFFSAQFHEARTEFARARYLRSTLVDIPRVLVEAVLVLFILGLLVVTVARDGMVERTLAVLGMFAYAVLRMSPAVNRLVANINNLRFGEQAVQNVLDDLVAVADQWADASAREPVPLPFEREIHLDGVSFRYENADVDALSAVDLRIARGEFLGIVGPTGGGKSTLLDVVMGLMPPSGGRVTVDGVDILGRERAWQRHIGMVPQAIFLLDDSLRRNVAFGVPDEEIDEDAFWEAIRLAQLEEYVRALPQGADTSVGERGVRISGGQRQRVAIARALYRRPSVLVFDEGTSALDNHTEALLIDAIEALRQERTIITVAHRLTTVRRSDRIVVVQGGRIEDQGTYEELTDRSGSFRSMGT